MANRSLYYKENDLLEDVKMPKSDLDRYLDELDKILEDKISANNEL